MDDPATLHVAVAAVPDMGPARVRALLAAFGDLRAALAAAERGAAPPPGVPRDVFSTLPARLDVPAAARTLRQARAAGLRVLTLGGPGFPRALARRQERALPTVLYVHGELGHGMHGTVGALRAAAVVGTRRATDRGLSLARALAFELAALDVAVVSGLALGIDTAAHEGALAGGGPTVAVLGSGHGHLHPRSNAALARRIVARGGAVLSEYPPDTAPEPFRFPDRNRIISAMSRITVVVEAPRRSGALLTALAANDQGRTVLAAPGRPGDPFSAGANRLIADGGAGLLADLEDALCHFRAGAPRRGGTEARARTDTHPGPAADAGTGGATAGPDRVDADPLLAALGARDEPTLDALAAAVGRPPHELLGRLVELELAGRVERTAAGRFRLRRRA